MSKPRRECADCGHDISVHKYDPEQDPERLGKTGPHQCRLCDCEKYRRPAPYERVRRRPLKSSIGDGR